MTAPDPLEPLRGIGPFEAVGNFLCCESEKGTAVLRTTKGIQAIAHALNLALEADAKLAAAREEIAGLQAEVDVLRGVACEEEQIEHGSGPCGVCAVCLREEISALRAQLAALREAAADIGKDATLGEECAVSFLDAKKRFAAIANRCRTLARAMEASDGT